MHGKLLLVLVLSVILNGLLLFTGCSKEESVPNMQGRPAESALAGTWVSGCQETNANNSHRYAAIFTDTTQEYFIYTFDAGQCKTAISTQRFKYTVAMDDAVGELERELVADDIAFHSDTYVSGANTFVYYGYGSTNGTPWVKGEYKDILGKSRISATAGVEPSKGVRSYLSFSVSENVLRLSNEGASPETRGTDFTSSVPLIRH